MTEYASGGSVTDSLAATGAGTAFVPTPGRPVLVTITGTWAGTVKVQKSRDGGTTYNDMTVAGSAWASFTANANEAIDEAEHGGVRYRAYFTRTSGTAVVQLGH